MATSNKLTAQVVLNELQQVRDELEATMSANSQEFDSRIAECLRIIEQAKEVSAQNYAEIVKRIDNIDSVINTFNQTAESWQDVRKTLEELKNSFEEKVKNVPEPDTPVLIPKLGASWSAIKKHPWFPWAKTTVICLVLLGAYQYMNGQGSLPSFIPGVKTNYDVNTPSGAASQGVSQEPFRSDTESRRQYGLIFNRLDEKVRSGAIKDFEAYYNEFRYEVQGSIKSNFNDWVEFWNRLALVCHQYGKGANDLNAFNDNLQSAARVVADTR